MAELGTLLGGRYRLDQVLGQGGMATIFRATDDKLGREVAVKVLRPEFGADAQFVERFEHEAQAAASLSHPNIVQVHDYGTDVAGPYIVMEQVSGGDLSSALGKKGNLPPTAVANMGQQVADALAAAHATGLVHRDIKPSNILLSPDGRVQVADFGIAQAAAGSPVTATGITLGSVLYFSPEQARGDTATAASDIYSLGLVMFEMLTGQRAFSGDSPAAVAVARLSGGVPSPMAVRAEVPPALDAIVRWCLAVDPAARPSAAELSTALARFRTDPSGAAALAAAGAAAGAAGPPRVPPPPGAARPPTQTAYMATTDPADPERSGSGPWAWLAAGLGLLVIVASGILLFLLFSGIGEEQPTPSPTPEPTAELVSTPNFVGLWEQNALTRAENRGVVLEITYHETDEVEAGRVTEQLPEPKTEVPAGTTVQVTVATQVETVVVPDVHGIKEDVAIAQLEDHGLFAGTRSTTPDLQPEGYVVSTDPRAGSSVARGSTVDLMISLGRIPMPPPSPRRRLWSRLNQPRTMSWTPRHSHPQRSSSSVTSPASTSLPRARISRMRACSWARRTRTPRRRAGSSTTSCPSPASPCPSAPRSTSCSPIPRNADRRSERRRVVVSIFDHPDSVQPVPSWRCPECRTLQPETTHCWRCDKPAFTCESCSRYRASVATDLGYCVNDPARAPLSAHEIRSCWESAGVTGLGVAGSAVASAPGLFDEADIAPPAPPAPAVARPAAPGVRPVPKRDRRRQARPPLEAPGRAAWVEPESDALVEAPVVEPEKHLSTEVQRRRRRWFR